MIARSDAAAASRCQRIRRSLIELGNNRLIRGIGPWVAAAAGSLLLVVWNPFTGSLDRGSILAVGGLILAIAAVTVGLVSVLAQHLAETYARSLVYALLGRSTWLIAAAGESLGLVLLVVLALWRPDESAGAVAGVVLVCSLYASAAAVLQLFWQFDPLSLVRLQTVDALERLVRARGAPEATRTPRQSILSLLVTAAGKADTEVVAASLAAWNQILDRYLSLHTTLWNDEYLYWLFARCEELLEQHARESVGLILPTVVEGVSALGVTSAAHTNALNAALDEGTFLFTESLVHVVQLAGTSKRSPAAQMAADGLGQIGEACVSAGKFAVLQAPIDALIKVGVGTAANLPDIASRASIGLSKILLVVAAADDDDVMRLATAEDIVQGLALIVEKEKPGLGPGHFLVAPLSDLSVPRLCQALVLAPEEQRVAMRRRPWDELALVTGRLPMTIAKHQSKTPMVRESAVEAAGTTILAILAGDQREALLKLVEELSTWIVGMAIDQRNSPASADALSAVSLACYVSSDPPRGDRATLRKVVLDVADRIRMASPATRRRLSPVLRRIGATALYFEDGEMADVMGGSTLTKSPSGYPSSQPDAPFEVSRGLGMPYRLTRPGVKVVPASTFFADPELQARFLKLEQEKHESEEKEVGGRELTDS
jgi:hypothetical protein